MLHHPLCNSYCVYSPLVVGEKMVYDVEEPDHKQKWKCKNSLNNAHRKFWHQCKFGHYVSLYVKDC